jgi:hypothetical protein
VGEPGDALAAAWRDLADALGRAERRVLGPGVPDSPRDRAEGFRHLLRFLTAGHLLCVEHADPDHPEFVHMVEPAWKWGLDMPDCLYLYAPVRGDAAYRIHGRRGSANHLDVQVNWGHFALGDLSAWGTVSSLSGLDLELDRDGRFELRLGGARPPGGGSWLPLAPTGTGRSPPSSRSSARATPARLRRRAPSRCGRGSHGSPSGSSAGVDSGSA